MQEKIKKKFKKSDFSFKNNQLGQNSLRNRRFLRWNPVLREELSLQRLLMKNEGG